MPSVVASAKGCLFFGTQALILIYLSKMECIEKTPRKSPAVYSRPSYGHSSMQITVQI